MGGKPHVSLEGEHIDSGWNRSETMNLNDFGDISMKIFLHLTPELAQHSVQTFMIPTQRIIITQKFNKIQWKCIYKCQKCESKNLFFSTDNSQIAVKATVETGIWSSGII